MMLLCLRYIANREDAKDVLMEGFFNAFKNIEKFTWQGEGSLKAWLKKIMVNQCLMHLRKQHTTFVSTTDNIEQYEYNAQDAPVFESMDIKEIMKMIHVLPDGYRTIFNLYVFEEMNHREIAELLGISENTSKSQLHKARAILKKQILQTN